MILTRYLPPPVIPTVEEEIFYPSDDGKPMSDNTKQFHGIITIESNLEIQYAHDLDVFVIGNLLWYPVEGRRDICQAPDVMVVFGRPKGDRLSYLQWREEKIAPQVVFEILSPSNRKGEMAEKFAFYNKYGVEEYYLYDPHRGGLQGWLRVPDGDLEPIKRMQGWRSPRLGVRFEMDGKELRLFYTDGRPFLTMLELNEKMHSAELRAGTAEDRADAAVERARTAMELAETEWQRAEDAVKHAKSEKQRADAEATRADLAVQRAAAEAQRAAVEAKARADAEGQVRALEEKLRQAGLL